MPSLLPTRLATRLIAAFSVVVAIGSAMGIAGVVGMARVEHMTQNLYALDLVALSAIKEANVELIATGRSRWQFIASHDPAERASARADALAHQARVQQLLDQAAPLLHLPAGQRLMGDLRLMVDGWRHDTEAFLVAAEAVRDITADPALRESSLRLTEVNRAVDAKLSEMSRFKEQAAAEVAKDARATHDRIRLLLVSLVAVGALAGITLGVLIARGISRSLGGEPETASAIAARVADGDLSEPIRLRTGDQTSLLAALARMQARLADTVSGIRITAEQVARASGEIAQGNADLANRTEQQASALEQTAAAMEELTGTVASNANHARDGSELANGARGLSDDGGRVIGDVVATMQRISDSSRRIADILATIDSIAFQTNILALNAAVEAARAGEEGRGFAVVAGEVRTLAQRSADAAREIRTLIADSVAHVEEGRRHVGDAGSAMNEIVRAIDGVASVTTGIAHASADQSLGIGQVMQAIQQMDRMTQQNAALVEQGAAASASLQEQARGLLAAMQGFRLARG